MASIVQKALRRLHTVTSYLQNCKLEQKKSSKWTRHRSGKKNLVTQGSGASVFCERERRQVHSWSLLQVLWPLIPLTGRQCPPSTSAAPWPWAASAAISKTRASNLGKCPCGHNNVSGKTECPQGRFFCTSAQGKTPGKDRHSVLQQT